MTNNTKEIYFIVIEDNGFERKFFSYNTAKEYTKSFGGRICKVVKRIEVLEEIGNGVWA